VHLSLRINRVRTNNRQTLHVNQPPYGLRKANDSFKFLSTHADRQGVDISFTVRVFFVCFFVRLRISPPRIKLAASNFGRRFIGVQCRESPILGNFASPGAQNRTNYPHHRRHGCPALAGQPWRRWRGCAHGPRVGSACVDIQPFPKTDVLVSLVGKLITRINSHNCTRT